MKPDDSAAGATGGNDADAVTATPETRPLERGETSSLGSLASVMHAIARAPSASQLWPMPGDRLGRYIVLGRLGAGGTGVVLSAFDPQLDRKVAIKLLRRDVAETASARARERIEREARALARLGHPNIVAVYDVGTLDDDLYIVMEMVVGETLRSWIAVPDHSTGDILGVFAQAGAGLIAAHAAGLIHRDFKPDNVLIGVDGRARVADFGLVRSGAPAPAGAAGAAAPILTPTDPGATAAPDGELTPAEIGHAETVGASTLTADGAFLGTPVYMAPEQLVSAEVDARADQFAFCVSLWEALYGVRPFKATQSQPRLAEIAAGPRTPDKPPRKVPAWLRALLVRGLAVEPGDRHPSLRALLDAIDRRRRPRRALAAGAIAVVAAAALALWITRTPATAPVCATAPAELARVWNPTRADAVARSFGARGAAGATLGATVRHDLDAWGTTWVEQHTAACRATKVASTQSPALLDQRMACLRRMASQLDAVVTTLARGDARALEHAGDLVDELPPSTACGDVDTLARTTAYPTEPGVRREIEQTEDTLATVLAQRWDQPLATLQRDTDAALARARKLAWPPLLTGALDARGTLCMLVEDHACARDAFRESVTWAFASSLDRQAITLIGTLAEEEARTDRRPEAAAWLDVADALAARFPGDAEIRRVVTGHRAQVLRMLGRLTEALAAARESVALVDGDAAASAYTRAAIRNTLGSVLTDAGQYDEAVTVFEQSLALDDGAVKDGPASATALNNLSAALTGKGDLVAGCDRAQRALSISETWYGPDHVALANPINNLATCKLFSGDTEGAMTLHQRAIALTEKGFGKDSTEYATELANVAAVHAGLDQFDQAVAMSEQALAILERTLGPDHVKLVVLLEVMGYTYRHVARYADAERVLRRAIAINDATFPDGSASTANAHNELGFTELGTGNRAAATAQFEESVAIAIAHPDTSPIVAAEARLQLAKLLRAQGGLRSRIRDLAAQARDDYHNLGPGYATQAAEAAALAR